LFRNTLYTIWLSYTTRAIRQVDDKVLETMKKIKSDENVPIYREEDVISAANHELNENTLLDINRLPEENGDKK
jgi:hypothetical protein